MKDILLRQPDGNFFYLYYREKCNALLLRQYDNTGTPRANPTVLRKNVEPHFSAIQDLAGNIHVAFSTSNSIQYGYFTENAFRSFPVLTAKSPMLYPKHVCILAQKKPATIFYLIHHKGKPLLSMQQVDNVENAATPPVAIDYLCDTKQNFAACQEKNGIIHLAYSRTSPQTDKIIHVIRELDSNGTAKKQHELPISSSEALYIDFLGFDKNNSLTLLSHSVSYHNLYLCTIEEEITQTIIDLNAYPAIQSTFFGPLTPGKDIKTPRDVVGRNFDT